MADSDWEVIGVGPSADASDDWEVVGIGEPIAKREAGTLEKAASGYLSGLAGIGDLIDFGAENTMPVQIARALGIEQSLPKSGQAARDLFDAATGIDDSTLVGEGTLPYKIASYVPGSFLGGGSALKNAGLAAVSALGGYASRPVGEILGESIAGEAGKEKGGLAADVLGSLLAPYGIQAGAKLAGPLVSERAREALAGKALLANAGAEGESAILRALQEGDTMAVSGPRTYAEMAGTPSAAQYQTIMNQSEGANVLGKALETRAAAQDDILQALKGNVVSPGATADDIGSLIRSSGLPIVDERAAAVEKVWQALPRQERLDLSGVRGPVEAAIQKFETPLGFSRDANKLISYLNENDLASMSIDDYLKLRSAAGEVKGAADAVGKVSESSVLAALRQSLDEAAAGVAKGPIAETAALKQTYGSGAVGGVFEKGEYGQFRLRESAIPAKVIATPEAAKQYAKAFAGDEKMINLGRTALINELQKSGQPGRFSKKYGELKGQFRALFADDLDKVETVLDDIDAVKGISQKATRASKGQSATNLYTVARRIYSTGPLELYKTLGNPKVGGAGALAAGAYTGDFLSGFMAWAGSQAAMKTAKDVQALIVKGMADPETLKVLASEATKPNLIKGMSLLGATLTGNASQALSSEVVQDQTEVSSDESQLDQFAEESETSQSLPVVPRSTSNPYRDPMRALLDKAISNAQAKIMTENEPNQSTKKANDSNDFERLTEAVIKQESAGNAKAVSKVGAKGLMQIMPATAKEIAQEIGLKDYDLEDPETNRMMGEHYLKKMLSQFKGDVELALAAYNAGPGRVRQWIKRYGPKWDMIAEAIRKKDPRHETVAYVGKILRNFNSIEV